MNRVLSIVSIPSLLMLLFLGGSPVSGQDDRAPAAAQKSLPELLTEIAYYVPFEQIEQVFEKPGRGIFLPYEKFLELWNRAHGSPTPEPIVPPAAAVLRGGTYQGSVLGEVARFEVRYSLEALQKGWSDVSLPLRMVAVEAVELSHPDMIFSARGEGYAAFLPRPGNYELSLRLSVRVKSEPGKKSIRFGIPATAVSRLDLEIPEEQIRVEVTPSLAVTQTTPQAGSTRVLAFLGNSTEVSVSWLPPAGKVADGGAILSAQQEIRVLLGERILKIQTTIDYEVLRGEVDTLRVQMPRDTRLISVVGENYREWLPEDDILTVRLHAPIQDTYRLSLSFERILDQTPATLSVPFPQPQDVFRESGWAVFGNEEGLNVRVTGTRGLSQLDPKEVPESLRPHLGVGFRYFQHPLSLDLSVEKITPVVRTETVSVVTLGKEEDLWSGWIDYAITKAGLFRLSFRIPADWSVDTVGDRESVEEFQTTTEGDRKLITVSLKSKALGPFRLPFRLTRNGTARAGELSLSPPEVIGTTQDRGLFGIGLPRSLEASSQDSTNLIDADIDELLRTGIMGQIGNQTGLPRTYRYREQPASTRLVLKERKTEIDVLAQHLVEVADGEIRITHLLDYNVLYAPVTRLQFQAPSALDETLKVEAKQKTQEGKQPDGEGMTLWSIDFQPPVLGPVTVTLAHTVDLQGLVAGQPLRQVVPLIHAVSVRGEQGYVAVRKEGTLEIAPAVEEMEVMDSSDLPDKLRRGQIYSAFRYFAARPALTLDLTRFDYEQLATTVVQLLQMKSVLSEERKLLTEAILYVQNTDRQFLEILLSPEARILSLVVANREQSPRKRKDGEGTLIRIPSSAGAGGTFPIHITYDQPVANTEMGSFGGVHMKTLELLDNVPVTKLELDLFLPPQYVYLGWKGNLYRRTLGRPGLAGRFRELLSGGNASPGATGAAPLMISINTDRYQRHTFDTLAPSGELRFSYMGKNLYSFVQFLFLVAGLAGTFALFRQRPRMQRRDGAIALFGALVLAWFATGPAGGFFAALLLGVVLVIAGRLALDIAERWQRYRSEQLAYAPDPFIEEAPVRGDLEKTPGTDRPAPPAPNAPTGEQAATGSHPPDNEPDEEPAHPSAAESTPAAKKRTRNKNKKKPRPQEGD